MAKPTEMDKRLLRVHECLIHANGKCIREVHPEGYGDTIEFWSVNGKLIIVQYWAKGDGISCYRAIQDQNNMDAEIKALDIYINS